MVDVITAMTMFSANTPMHKLSRSNGLGTLSEAIDPLVTYEESGTLDLEFKYPSNGIHFADLKRRNIIVAKPTRYMSPFPFRIYEITKPINGLVTVRAEDITHDLSGYTVSPFTMEPIRDEGDDPAPDEVLGRPWRETGYVYIDEYLDYVKAYCDLPLDQIKYNFEINAEELADVDHIFTYKIQADANGLVEITKPLTLRQLLGTDGNVGVIGIFGGSWSYSIDYESGYITMTLYSTRGSDRGVQIRYGKNMTGMTYTESTSGLYTGIYPYWYKASEGFVDLLSDEPDETVSARGRYQFSDKNGKYRYCVDAYEEDDPFADYEVYYNYIMPVDFSGKFPSAPSSDELWDEATKYIRDNNVGFPSESLTVSFIDLSQSSEYAQYAILEEVRLGDIVTIYHPEMKIAASMSVNKMVYNVATNKYKSIDIGKPVIFISDTIAEIGLQTVSNEDSIKKTKVQHSHVEHDFTRTYITSGTTTPITIQPKSDATNYSVQNGKSLGPSSDKYAYTAVVRIPGYEVKPYMYAYINSVSESRIIDSHTYRNDLVEISKKTKIDKDSYGYFIRFFYNYTETGASYPNPFNIFFSDLEVYYYV